MLADMTWSVMYTILKTELSKKHANLSYTTSDMNKTTPKLPNLFVNHIGGSSTGEDLEGTTENAIISVFQLEVSSSTSLDEARKIMNSAEIIMTKKGYRTISTPFQQNTSVYRIIARFSRRVGTGDNLQAM